MDTKTQYEITKKVIQKNGIGSIPFKYQEIFFFVEFYDKVNLLLADFPNYPQRCVINRNQLFEPLEKALQNMIIGERSTFYIDHENIDRFEVEVLKFGQIQNNIWDFNDTQRAQAAAEQKDLGNSLIKQNDFINAEERYNLAEKIIHDDSGEIFDALKFSIQSNLTLSYLKNNKNQECVQVAQDIKDNNIKILYRCTQALMNMGKYDEAMYELQSIFKIEPENKDAKNLQQLIEKQVKNQQQKEKQIFKKMFS